ncbi:unnamed protein product [Caenorhabditis angaria]|uniref:Clathrin/coatomer adaptor adaptin-like N-terminal domain-containing protein n=1 Tax=Caenorhabditis angaria TaxID=860376 RepID=A0A9P1J1U0_9PELO|nr:unnamed protein product [Caenorhabditis angaria]
MKLQNLIGKIYLDLLTSKLPFSASNVGQLGYDISWASFNVIEVMASTKYTEKRIGYLAAAQSFHDETEVLMLTTNLIRKDVNSSNMYKIQAHKDIVLRCLDDKDESIRLRSLDLFYGMISKKNIVEIVKKSVEHVEAAEGSHYRDELLSRIIGICICNNYQYITNFEWYISVLVELTKFEATKHGAKIAEQIKDVTGRVESIRHFSVSQMALIVENAHVLLAGSAQQRSNLCEVLLAAAWICGEYSHQAEEENDDWDAIESLDNLMLSKFPQFELSEHSQERACTLMTIIRIAEGLHQKKRENGS